MIFNAHIKTITDLKWISLKNHASGQFDKFISSCSFDGFIKIWDYSSNNLVPIYEHFTSKKWVHGLYYDQSISALFVNQEGKNCPQKILYFKPYQYDLGENDELSDGEEN